MSRRSFWILPVALSAAAVGIGSLACQGDELRRVRAATYPPDFHYITRQEIRTTMGQLAAEVVALDEIMRRPGGPGSADQDAVLSILTRSRALAVQLNKGTRSNHPRIDRDSARLESDIQRALNGARATPPNYYDAGRVVGACSYCHEPRHAGAAGLSLRPAIPGDGTPPAARR